MARKAVAACTVFVLICIGPTGTLLGQQVVNVQQVAQPDTLGPNLTKVTSIGTFWQLTEKAGWLRWFIFAVFIVGLFLVITKVLELAVEKRRTRHLLMLDFAHMSLGEIHGAVRKNGGEALPRLLSSLIHLFRSTGSAQGFNEEIGNYLRLQQERFNTFRMWMAFLSDTAGALGLLGTVWGIFTTFFGGALDNQTILNGMAVALLTTLLGLIVSIVLNLTATQVSSVFSRMLDRAAGKADELRFRLMEMQAAIPSTRAIIQEAETTSVNATSSSAIPVRPEVDSGEWVPGKPTDREVEVQTEPAVLHIEITSAPPEQAFVGTLVEPPIEGRVVDADGRPQPRVGLRCRIVEGEGSLGQDGREMTCTTDAQGRFHIPWRLGKTPGLNVVTVATDDDKDASTWEVRCQGIAGPAEELHIVSGNHQGAKAGQPLPMPLVVEVRDAFQNPVPSVSVQYTVRSGGGHFEGDDRTELTVHTDASGCAEVGFVLGSEPGLNEVAAAIDPGRTSVIFQVFGEA